MVFLVCSIPFSTICFMQKMLSVHDRPVRNQLCSSSFLFFTSMMSLSTLPYNLLITLVTKCPQSQNKLFCFLFVYLCNVSNFPLLHSFFSIQPSIIIHVSTFFRLSVPCFSISAYTPSGQHDFLFFSSLTAFHTLSSLTSTVYPSIYVGEIFLIPSYSSQFSVSRSC